MHTKKRSKKRSTGHKHEKAKLTRKETKGAKRNSHRNRKISKGSNPPIGFKQTSQAKPRRTVPPRKRVSVPHKKRKVTRPKGFVYADAHKDRSDQALTTIDNALAKFSSYISGLGVNNSVKTYAPYQDGSVSGQCTTINFARLSHNDWYRLLHEIAGFDSWPVAHAQTQQDVSKRKFGCFWFSLELVFNVPDNRKWKSLETRYERYKGAWRTSTYWSNTRNANMRIIDFALWGKNQTSVPELLEQKKYGYKLQSISFRLVWTDGEKPQWR